MKTTITIISLSAILACLTLLAQESPRPAAGGSLDGLFKRLDRNGDGKLTRDEVADAAAFAAADADKNGAVAPDEFRRYVATRQRPRPTPAPATAKPAPALPPVNGRPVLKQLPDCDAVRDAAGRGQLFECMHVGGITDVRKGMNGFALADLNRDGRPDVIATFSPPSSYHGTKLVPPSRPTSSSKSTSRQDEQPQSERKQNDEPTQRTIQPPRVPSCDRPVAGLGLVTSATTSHTTWAKAWSTE